MRSATRPSQAQPSADENQRPSRATTTPTTPSCRTATARATAPRRWPSRGRAGRRSRRRSRRTPRRRPAPGRRARRGCAIRSSRFLAEARRYKRLSEDGGARAGRGGARARRPERRPHAGRAQPAPGHRHRVPVPARLDEHPRPVPGGERRPDGGGQALGAEARPALRHLRRLLDPRLRAALPDDQLAPHPRRQHARGAQAVLPPGEGAAEAAGRRHRRDAQAAGRQAGRRREGSGRGAPAPGVARGAVRSAARARPRRRRRRTRCPSGCRRRRRVARGRGGARRAGDARCRSWWPASATA